MAGKLELTEGFCAGHKTYCLDDCTHLCMEANKGKTLTPVKDEEGTCDVGVRLMVRLTEYTQNIYLFILCICTLSVL